MEQVAEVKWPPLRIGPWRESERSVNNYDRRFKKQRPWKHAFRWDVRARVTTTCSLLGTTRDLSRTGAMPSGMRVSAILAQGCPFHNDDAFVTDSQLTRKTPPAYSDGVYMMAGFSRPSPRKLSQIFMDGEDGLPSGKNRTALFALFGKLKSPLKIAILVYKFFFRPSGQFWIAHGVRKRLPHWSPPHRNW